MGTAFQELFDRGKEVGVKEGEEIGIKKAQNWVMKKQCGDLL